MQVPGYAKLVDTLSSSSFKDPTAIGVSYPTNQPTNPETNSSVELKAVYRPRGSDDASTGGSLYCGSGGEGVA